MTCYIYKLFLIYALFKLSNKNNKRTYMYVKCLSHIINYQNASIPPIVMNTIFL